MIRRLDAFSYAHSERFEVGANGVVEIFRNTDATFLSYLICYENGTKQILSGNFCFIEEQSNEDIRNSQKHK